MNMITLIRSLIKESVLELQEMGFSDSVVGGLEKRRGEDQIIGDRRKAIVFAQNTLMKDIHELGNYQLVDYLPIDQSKEKWTFEAETSGEYLNTITIKRVIKDGASHWVFAFGKAIKSMERMTVEMEYRTGLMPNYEAFVRKVNADWQQWG